MGALSDRAPDTEVTWTEMSDLTADSRIERCLSFLDTSARRSSLFLAELALVHGAPD